ncbi:E3 ubiquitin-protein ligase SPL1 [Capsella rubella]|uniref:E3 ubiquitin-protein ligase SPL1 n=1 Tax=Capsella rubella TaxID=81985 RepID=UPI000CD56988|nr:E3 ubiquitin-protein ligase SPL1 [Capsella rubella]
MMIQLGGLACCLSGSFLDYLSKIPASFVKSVTRVRHIKDLEQLVPLESKVVAVSGIVGSETPLKCKHSDMLCVFIEETAQQLFLKRNWMFSWVPDCNWMVPITKEVPWYLDDGTGRVNVEANKVRCFELKVGSKVFQESEPSSECHRGLEMLGVLRTERVLPIGTSVTIIGEAVKDSIGGFTIQESKEVPFFVSSLPFDELISSFGKWSRKLKYASIGFTVVGVVLILKPVVDYMLERRRRRLLRKRVADAAVKRAKLVTRGLEAQDGDLLDLCVICLEHKNDAAFVWSYVLLLNMFLARKDLSSLP